MKVTYSYLDPEWRKRILLENGLQQLFQRLLLFLGDADKALEAMRALEKKGFLSKPGLVADFEAQLRKQGLISGDSALSGRTASVRKRTHLTQKGNLKLREAVFKELFSSLKRGALGEHTFSGGSQGRGELGPEKRAFQFGDDLKRVDFSSSLFNAIKRQGSFEMTLQEQDLEVFEKEASSSCALVLLIDISHSMILYGEDRITPAKELAIALSHLILTNFPRDSLSVVLFGNEATTVPISELVKISAGPYYTNTQLGLRKARELLLKTRQPNKQIVMITDGKPSVMQLATGRYYRNAFGLDPKIVKATLDEALLCRRKEIVINTFMLTEEEYLRQFVRKLTELNRGQAFYCRANHLSSFVMENFLRSRRSL